MQWPSAQDPGSQAPGVKSQLQLPRLSSKHLTFFTLNLEVSLRMPHKVVRMQICPRRDAAQCVGCSDCSGDMSCEDSGGGPLSQGREEARGEWERGPSASKKRKKGNAKH